MLFSGEFSRQDEGKRGDLALQLVSICANVGGTLKSRKTKDSADTMRFFTCLLLMALLCCALSVPVQEAAGQDGISQETAAETLLVKLDTAQGAERVEVLIVLAQELQRRGRQDEALPRAQEAEALARKLDLPKARASALRLIGDSYNMLGQTQQGLVYLTRSMDAYEQLGLAEEAARVQVNRCSIRTRVGRYTDALKDCLDAHDSFPPDNLNGRAASLNSLGVIYLELNRTEEALKYFEEALELSERSGNAGRTGRLLNNIALIQIDRGEYQQALKNLRQSLQIKQELGDQIGVARRLNNIGKVHVKRGDLEAARTLFLEALSLAREVQYQRGEASSLTLLADLARRTNDRRSAIDLLQQAATLRDREGEPAAARGNYQDLAELYSEEGMYREAYEALKEYGLRQSEFVDRAKREAFEEMQSRFESERQQQRIDMLEQEKGLARAELARQRFALYSLLAGSALVLAIVFLLVNRYRQKIKDGMLAENLERERKVSARLREVDKLKDEFLANTSHELRTPLYGITGLAESLIDGAAGDLPETARANLAMISASGRRLAGLVGDLLDFSKLQRQGLELVLQPVGIHAITDVVLTMSRPLAQGKELKLVNEVDPELPAAHADENRVYQILLNLVGNAIKFTERGQVTVSMQPVGDDLMVRVADTGIGIPPAQLERIFESFQQGDASIEREYGGTGLGLAVSQQLVELHGGRIWAESMLGEGAIFSFTLPVAKPQDHKEDDPGRSESLPVLEPSSYSITAALEVEEVADGPLILTVDDEPVVRQVLRNHLTAAGYRLRQAASGSAALKVIERETVDLVLLDVMMPRMSGYEVCRRLRQRFPAEELPVIFLSAKDQNSHREMGLAEGASDYLRKPLSKEELLLRVKTHLDLLAAHRRSKEEVNVLRGLLPVCAGCKRIKDDQGYWNEIETYIRLHTEAELSHGLCLECAQDLYPELDLTGSSGA